jgi:hypothetical protein
VALLRLINCSLISYLATAHLFRWNEPSLAEAMEKRQLFIKPTYKIKTILNTLTPYW